MSEVAADVTVDDRVNAGVGVGQTVRQSSEDLVGSSFRLADEVDDEEMDMEWEPAHGEGRDDGTEDLRYV